MTHAASPRLLLLLVVLAALPGTGGCNLFFPFAPDQLCETEIRARCRFAFSCCNAAERARFTAESRFRNEAECVEELLEETGACGNAFIVQDAVVAKRFEYDNALAEKCLRQRIDLLNACDAQGIVDLLNEAEDEDCANVDGFAFGNGLVEDGDPCFADFECEVDGSRCVIPPDDDPADNEAVVTAVGECQAPLEAGDACTEDDDEDGLPDGFCEEGTFCDALGSGDCEELADDGDDCTFDADCKSGFCNDVGNNAAAPECDDRLDEGDECIDDDDCAVGTCVFDEDEDASFCTVAELTANYCNGVQNTEDVEF